MRNENVFGRTGTASDGGIVIVVVVVCQNGEQVGHRQIAEERRVRIDQVKKKNKKIDFDANWPIIISPGGCARNIIIVSTR